VTTTIFQTKEIANNTEKTSYGTPSYQWCPLPELIYWLNAQS